MVKNNQIISDDERKAIKELSEIIDELNVTEIEIQNEKVGKVRVSKNKTIPNHSNNTPTIKTSAPKHKEENLVIEDTIKSPMVGTVYLQPEPESDTFVKVGDKVKKGQTPGATNIDGYDTTKFEIRISDIILNRHFIKIF